MTVRRGTAAAIALLFVAALAAAGCGIGPGEGRGDVALTVTRDYGAEVLLDRSVGDVTESDTVMRVLDRNTEIETRYGGAFVQSIEGIEGEQSGGHPYDWFFYVNGLWSPVGAAEYALRGGEEIWWDYRDWSVGTRVAAVVGSWPQPFSGGYEGSRHPTAVECLGEGVVCEAVRRRLRDAGASLVTGSSPSAIRVLVGPWVRLRGDRDAASIEDEAQVSGVFAEFTRQAAPSSAVPLLHIGRQRNSGSFELRGLDQAGRPIRAFGPSAGLVAATRRYDSPPTWVVTGATAAGVRAAASLLNTADLRDHYAVATEGGEEFPLPLGR
jgi:hypothetical protein